MKITKLSHSCLLVEMPEPVNRTALFDPGVWSEEYVDVDSLVYLDDIFITHSHADHLSVPLLRKLLSKFPEVRITAPPEVVYLLKQESILATSEEFEGVKFFDAPHEHLFPGLSAPEQLGIHYLDKLTSPGDSHSFSETRDILALPVQAPWGSTVRAVELTLELQPRFVLPVHDWHWNDAAKEQMYERLQELFEAKGIEFVPLQNGVPVVLEV